MEIVYKSTMTQKGQFGLEVRDSYGRHDVFVPSEMVAMNLIGAPTSTDSEFSLHDAGNEIIALAERIKAERAVVAML
jgi:hypothetical protein